MSLLDDIRDLARQVAERATHVQIDLGRLRAYARELASREIPVPHVDVSTHYLGETDSTCAFFLTLDTINFGSGFFRFLQKRDGMSGYFTIAASLKQQYESDGPLTAEDLSKLTVNQCAAIFGQDPAHPVIGELMSLYCGALNELGEYVLAEFSGCFSQLVQMADGSAAKLVERLSGLGSFRDVYRYGDLEVPFFKRAQLAVADLSMAFDGQGLGCFHDLDRLTIFADNVVPHVLRTDGVLIYRRQLASTIDSGTLLASGSPEEIEIRACALHAAELLVEELRRQRRALTAMQLDYLLWNRGHESAYRGKSSHRARSLYY